jgi:ABC-type lipoprotein export system ATPase subunit
MGRAVVSLKGVEITFPRPGLEPLTVIDGLELAVGAGQMHVLAGRSGSGKTSLLRVAAGLVPPTAGVVSWGGDPLTGLTDDQVTARRGRALGYLDQAGALVPGLTAIENVLLPAVPDRAVRAHTRTARDLLHRVGVGERMHSRPDQLSGGERQRVALARALLRRPAAVLADEPTAGLDRASADVVIALLRNLTAEGVAVLVASHDPSLVAAGDAVTTLD